MFSSIRTLAGGIALAIALCFFVSSAHAVPSFARQTGLECAACHVGSFGPQLTPLGRAFKIGGYTQGGGEGWAAQVPLSAMLLGSFNNTAGSQPTPPANNFGRNNNFALDQISLFLAGRVTDWAGMFVQGTYDGIGKSVALDNTDVRLTHPFFFGEQELRTGLSVNNNPTVQDPFNTTFAWGFPYVSSALAPTPTAQPLLAGGLAGSVVGTTVYGWWDHRLYAEFGGYQSLGTTALKILGEDTGPGSVNNIAPYARLAYEWNWNNQSAHVGGILMYADINPNRDSTFGRDRYLDYGVDASYQFLGNRRHVVSAYGIFLHEQQDLNGTFGSGGAALAPHDLNQVRVNLSYYFNQTYGLTFGVQHTFGTADPVLYAPEPVSGSRTGKPDSTAFIVQADWTPFGKADSWAGPWVNLRLGVQYTLYTQFNGASSNYDGFGRNASANNTLYAFAWLAF